MIYFGFVTLPQSLGDLLRDEVYVCCTERNFGTNQLLESSIRPSPSTPRSDYWFARQNNLEEQLFKYSRKFPEFSLASSWLGIDQRPLVLKHHACILQTPESRCEYRWAKSARYFQRLTVKSIYQIALLPNGYHVDVAFVTGGDNFER